MKAFSLLLFSFLLLINSHSQNFATNFTVDDCDGNSHDLFTELNAGKIIVIGWTMPCSSCAAPLLDVHNSIINYVVSHPGVVEYWVVDDYGDTQCMTIEGWSAASGISYATFFSNSQISMSDYGSDGMPKVVVLGCSNHKVYYNTNNNPTGAGASAGIDAALADISTGSCTIGIDEGETDLALNCFPNPTKGVLNISFSSTKKDGSSIEIFEINGKLLKKFAFENLTSNSVQINVSDLESGSYLIKVNIGKTNQVKIIQVHK